jgi:hypothetical protein
MVRTKNDDATPERAAKGLISGWLTAKTTTWVARLTVWGMWLAALAAYGGYVWWRVRRMLRAEERADHGLEVRSGSQQPPPG